MFCYQRSFGLPTEVVTKEQFRALITAPETFRKVKEAREALARGDKNAYDSKKKSLPFVIFIATYDESESAKSKKRGRWRNQKYCRLNGLCVIDFDHLTPLNLPEGEKNLREIWDEAYSKLSEEDKARILLVYITPSGHGLKVVFMADVNVGNLIDNQIVFSRKLGLNPDEACKDASRGAFLTTKEDIILLDERIIDYEDPAFGEKYNEAYHEGKSQPTITNTNSTNLTNKEVVSNTDETDQTEEKFSNSLQSKAAEPSAPILDKEKDSCSVKELAYHGVPFQTIIEAWLGDKKVEQGDRHRTSLVLADHLRYITDNDPMLIEQILRETPFVKEIVEERNEDVAQTVKSAQGYEFLKGIPRRLQQALKVAGALTQGTVPQCSAGYAQQGQSPCEVDVYDALPLDKWAEELQEMAEYYPCMKELFVNVHPHKLPAVWFSSAALFGTLMTRAYYHFWYEPEIVRRLNYCIFIIGDPGAGKNVIEKFYKKIADPMIQADSCLIDAVNRYKEGRTERTTSTKAQKGEALKRPVVGIRVHPARTATGEFIRHMNAAIETVEGKPLNLHMFSFDAELDNVTKQNKGGDWKDREILELKAFHNEEDGQMYANQESVTGMFNVFWNFIYTGTPYALHRKVNQRNFGTGMSTRLAVIPLPDKGLAKRRQQVDPNANETLREWAYRLDKVEGELPIEPLNDETYDWQSSHMEIAEFNGDKADRTLLKRIPYYGIGISLPYILMRHWEEWQEKRTLTMDDRDQRLCRLAMEIQYRCQQFFFGEMAYNYFADQNKEFVVRKRSTRYSECFRKLPDEFKTQQFMEVFGVSQQAASRAITRFRNDGLIEVVKYGIYKKTVSELP
jgi:Mn-dependent DtxR family transcriptional regulator